MLVEGALAAVGAVAEGAEVHLQRVAVHHAAGEGLCGGAVGGCAAGHGDGGRQPGEGCAELSGVLQVRHVVDGDVHVLVARGGCQRHQYVAVVGLQGERFAGGRPQRVRLQDDWLVLGAGGARHAATGEFGAFLDARPAGVGLQGVGLCHVAVEDGLRIVVVADGAVGARVQPGGAAFLAGEVVAHGLTLALGGVEEHRHARRLCLGALRPVEDDADGGPVVVVVAQLLVFATCKQEVRCKK